MTGIAALASISAVVSNERGNLSELVVIADCKQKEGPALGVEYLHILKLLLLSRVDLYGCEVHFADMHARPLRKHLLL